MTIAKGEVEGNVGTLPFEVDSIQRRTPPLNGLVIEHSPGVNGGVSIYRNESVPDPYQPGSWIPRMIPIEGAIDIPPGSSVSFNISEPDKHQMRRVDIAHYPKTKLIEISEEESKNQRSNQKKGDV
jgi:hypothetical protein